jgi:hypothetical protein
VVTYAGDTSAAARFGVARFFPQKRRRVFVFVREVRLAVAKRVRGRHRNVALADVLVGRGHVGRDTVRETSFQIDLVRLEARFYVRSTEIGTRGLFVVLRRNGGLTKKRLLRRSV